MVGKRIVLLLCAALALTAGAVSCGDDDELPEGTQTAAPTSSRSAFEQDALRTFCRGLQQQTGLDLATPEGAAQVVTFFDQLLQSAPSDIVGAVQQLRDAFQRVATAAPDQVPQVRDDIRLQVQAAFTALGGFQQSQCQGI